MSRSGIHTVTFGIFMLSMMSVRRIFEFPLATAIIGSMITIGFIASWYRGDENLPYLDISLGIFSLAAVVWAFSSLFMVEFNFEHVLNASAKALVGLGLFQSFSLRSRRDYLFNQIISLPLVTISALLSLEQDKVYLSLLAAILFLWIFLLRLSLLEQRERGCEIIVGDSGTKEAVISQLWSSALIWVILIVFSAFFFHLLPRPKPPSLGIWPSKFVGSAREFAGMEVSIEKRLREMTMSARMGKEPRPIMGEGPGPGIEAAKKETESTIEKTLLAKETTYAIKKIPTPRKQELAQKRDGSVISKLQCSLPKYLMRYALLWIAAVLLFLFIRNKCEQKQLRSLAVRNPRLFIIELYKSISKIFSIYKCHRLAWMTPIEYLSEVKSKWGGIADDFAIITERFSEARYSAHVIGTPSSCAAIRSYNEIFGKIQEQGKLWQGVKARFRRMNVGVK